MRINDRQKEELQKSLAEQKKLSLSLNEKNHELENSNQYIKLQYEALKSKSDSIQSFVDVVTLLNGINEKQNEIIEAGNGQSMSLEMKNAFDACVAIRSALESGSRQNLVFANNILKKYDTTPFSSLRCIDDEILSLDGHFIFNTDFIDSLIVGKDVYSHTQMFSSDLVRRGQLANGSILIKNCIVGKGATSKFRFASRGYQELAIVTEPGGLVTLKVLDRTNEKIYVNTDNILKGMSTRFISFDSGDKKVNLEIEIENKTNKDISFVVLSN